jgi:hypothetical protein
VRSATVFDQAGISNSWLCHQRQFHSDPAATISPIRTSHHSNSGFSQELLSWLVLRTGRPDNRICGGLAGSCTGVRSVPSTRLVRRLFPFSAEDLQICANREFSPLPMISLAPSFMLCPYIKPHFQQIVRIGGISNMRPGSATAAT